MDIMDHFKRNRRTVVFDCGFYYETLTDFCLHLGYTAQDIADLTGISSSTARRWLRSNTHPRWLLPFLWSCYGGILAAGFEGWRCFDKKICSPSMRYAIGYRQIEEYTFHLDLLHQYQSKDRRHKKTDHQTGSNIINMAKWK